MTSFIIAGSLFDRENYIKDFISENHYFDYEVERFEEKINVEVARNIKKALSFKVKTKKLIILMGEFSIEAQNALLKSIEESPVGVVFMFLVEKAEDLLPTISSRCQIMNLSSKEQVVNNEISENIRLLAQGQKNEWEAIEFLSEKLQDKEDVSVIVASVRQLLLENYEKKENIKYYEYLKKLLSLLPLYEKNNVQLRIIFEKTFLIDR